MALATLAICLKAPEVIMPAYVSKIGYQIWMCEQLSGEILRLSQALATVSSQQNQASTNDTVRVLLIRLPDPSLGGDNIAPQIAQRKASRKRSSRR